MSSQHYSEATNVYVLLHWGLQLRPSPLALTIYDVSETQRFFLGLDLRMASDSQTNQKGGESFLKIVSATLIAPAPVVSASEKKGDTINFFFIKAEI